MIVLAGLAPAFIYISILSWPKIQSRQEATLIPIIVSFYQMLPWLETIVSLVWRHQLMDTGTG